MRTARQHGGGGGGGGDISSPEDCDTRDHFAACGGGKRGGDRSQEDDGHESSERDVSASRVAGTYDGIPMMARPVLRNPGMYVRTTNASVNEAQPRATNRGDVPSSPGTSLAAEGSDADRGTSIDHSSASTPGAAVRRQWGYSNRIMAPDREYIEQLEREVANMRRTVKQQEAAHTRAARKANADAAASATYARAPRISGASTGSGE